VIGVESRYVRWQQPFGMHTLSGSEAVQWYILVVCMFLAALAPVHICFVPQWRVAQRVLTYMFGLVKLTSCIVDSFRHHKPSLASLNYPLVLPKHVLARWRLALDNLTIIGLT
jgi:hypothetical protein